MGLAVFYISDIYATKITSASSLYPKAQQSIIAACKINRRRNQIGCSGSTRIIWVMRTVSASIMAAFILHFPAFVCRPALQIELVLEIFRISIARCNGVCSATRPLAVRLAIFGPSEISTTDTHSSAGAELIQGGRLETRHWQSNESIRF